MLISNTYYLLFLDQMNIYVFSTQFDKAKWLHDNIKDSILNVGENVFPKIKEPLAYVEHCKGAYYRPNERKNRYIDFGESIFY